MQKPVHIDAGAATRAAVEPSRSNPWRAATDAPHLPVTGFLRQWQVLAFVPISKSTLWRRVHVGSFPEPVKLSARVTVWRAEDLRHWIDSAAATLAPPPAAKSSRHDEFPRSRDGGG